MIEEKDLLNDFYNTLDLKEGKVIPLINDKVFKFSMQQNNVKNFLSWLISYITKINKNHLHNNIYFSNTELPVLVHEKGKITDLLLENNKYSVDIEMNTDLSKEDLTKNNLYMHRLITLKLDSGQSYLELNDFFQISFNNKNLKDFMDDKLISKYVTQSKENNVIDEKLTFFQIDLSKAEEIYENDFDNLNEDDKRFIKFLLIMQKDDIVELREIAKNDKEMRCLVENIITASKDESILRLEYKQKLQEWADNAKNERKLKEATEKATIKSLKEGEQKGILKTAKNMLSIGIKKEDIAHATGLSLKEIENLK